MRIAILISLSLFLLGCSKVETGSNNVLENETPTPSPTILFKSESAPVLKPVSPNIELKSKQKKYLDETLPPDVRRMLEQSEAFELLAEVGPRETSETDLREFRPNRVVTVTNERQKKQILESFYSDAATQDGPASCFEPHHGLRVVTSGKTIEIEICFDCAQFSGARDLQSVSGTIVRKNRKSEKLFTQIVKDQSVELKQ